MKRGAIQAVTILVAVIVLCWLAVARHAAPPAVGEDAPPEAFSAARAMRHLREIAQRPHPIGTSDNRRVRDYLITELETLGLQTDLQIATVIHGWRVVRVENVVGRLRAAGTERGGAMLLVAHIDTVPMSPGAGDAGSGVATILETLRALKAGPQLSRDVIVLFSNPEEIFLHGATAFVQEHPWMADVGRVINIDPGGTTGPAYVHETSPGNRALIRALGRVAPHPIANSLASGVKRLQGDRNDEFHLFTEAGVPGFNIAFMHGDTAYHTIRDHPDNLDPDSLQHLGSYALSITRGLDEPQTLVSGDAESVFFNTLGSAFVHYPESWNGVLAATTAVLYVLAAAYGVRRRRLTGAGVLAGFLWLGLSLLSTVGTAWALWKVLGPLRSTADVFLTGNVYRGHVYLGCLVLVAVGLVAALYVPAFRRREIADLAFGAMIWWLLLMGVSLFVLPGGCFVFTWPLLFQLCAWMAAFATESGPPFDGRPALQLVGAVPVLLFFAPALYAMFAALSIDEAPFLGALVVLGLGMLLPCLRAVHAGMGNLPTYVALGLAMVLGVAAWRTPVDASRPGTDFIQYALDGDTQQALWATKSRARDDVRTDAFTAQFFRGEMTRERLDGFYPQSSSTFLQGPAPALPLAAPEAVLLEETAADGVRTLRLAIRSPRAAPILLVVAYERPLSWRFDGEPVEANQVLAAWNFDDARFELTLETSEPELNLLVVDQSYGLPGLAMAPRPPELIQEPSGGLIFTDATLVRRSFQF